MKHNAFCPRICMVWLGLLVACGLAGVLPVRAAQETVIGVPPEMLLGTLPQAPKDWKMTSSMGLNEISALPALLTFAIREYRSDPPPSDPALPPPPPKLTKITLLDTAFDPDRAFVFDTFKQPPSANAKHSTFKETPLVEQPRGDTKRFIAAKIDSRFILTMELQNQDDKDRDAWLDAIDFPKLRAWAGKAPRLPPPPKFFQVSSVNEMNPKLNQTLSVPYRPEEP